LRSRRILRWLGSSSTERTAHKSVETTPIKIETKKLNVSVHAHGCRWSVELKHSEIQRNNVYFLPNDDPSGWRVVGTVNHNDSADLGSFVTVTLHGTRPGFLDLEYKISIGTTGNNLLMILGRSNRTGKPVDMEDTNYFVLAGARLGGKTDRRTSLRKHSRKRNYCELWPVECLIVPKLYEVNHVVLQAD